MARENYFELSEALNQMMKISNRGNILVEGTIVAINDDFTCDVAIGEATQFNVPLRVLTGSQASVYEVPVEQTACLILFRDGNIGQPQILFIDQVDQLLINCQTVVQFNGGELGGMVKVLDLVTRMNNIEEKYNNLVDLFNTHVHSGVTTGPGVSGPTPSQGTTSDLTKRTDIENTKIQQ